MSTFTTRLRKFLRRYPKANLLARPRFHSRPARVVEALHDYEARSRAGAPPDLPSGPPVIGRIPFRSEACSSHHFLLDCFRYWCEQIREVPSYHRKKWEFVYVLQSLWERGMLAEGRRGLGFGVGQEPLPSLMASLGCRITATDLEASDSAASGWSKTDQHAADLSRMNSRGICPEDAFRERVDFRAVNMNEIPDDLRDYDFCWSACCFEHLGSIELGLRFVERSIDTLRPGGIAVHTTELNLSSDSRTLREGATVLFRRRDISELIDRLERQGHHVEPLLLHAGASEVDRFVDVPPYLSDPHLRLRLKGFVTTSVGIIVQRGTS